MTTTLSAIQYPHMQDRGAAAREGVTVIRADREGVTVATADSRTTTIPWMALRMALSQEDATLRAVYAAVHVIGADMLAQLPQREQGLEVKVDSMTGGATYVVRVTDASGRTRGDLCLADECGEYPHGWRAEKEAEVIRARLGI